MRSVRSDGCARGDQVTDLNAGPYLINIVAIVHKPLVHSGQPPLAPTDIISHKVITVFVDGVVGEMLTSLTLSSEKTQASMAWMYTCTLSCVHTLLTMLWLVGSR